MVYGSHTHPPIRFFLFQRGNLMCTLCPRSGSQLPPAAVPKELKRIEYHYYYCCYYYRRRRQRHRMHANGPSHHAQTDGVCDFRMDFLRRETDRR